MSDRLADLDEDGPFSLLEPVARAELLERELLTSIVQRHENAWDSEGCYFDRES